jgi:hypothetical protein
MDIVWCSSKNGYLKDMCLKEIEVRPQFMITILGLIVNENLGDLYDR